MNSTSASRPLLWPLVPIYNLGLALRELQLRSGIKPIRRLRWPVVSVGNLSTGGAGKTPTLAPARKKRVMSATARKRIGEATRRRWAAFRKANAVK